MLDPSRKPIAWGALQGRIPLSESTLAAARAEAARYYAGCEAEEFCGDEVGDFLPPDWLPPVREWFPMEAVRALGFRPELDGRTSLLATVGVDPHIDNFAGATFALCLANDGLTFGQGDQRHVTQAGEWFVFDDSVLHEVKETEQSTTYLCLTLPLRPLAAPSIT